MLIDCDRCEMRDIACSDCVVNVLLGGVEDVDSAEQRAIGVLADAGLVPPLRLTVVDPPRQDDTAPDEKKFRETWRRGLPHMRSAG